MVTQLIRTLIFVQIQKYSVRGPIRIAPIGYSPAQWQARMPLILPPMPRPKPPNAHTTRQHQRETRLCSLAVGHEPLALSRCQSAALGGQPLVRHDCSQRLWSRKIGVNEDDSAALLTIHRESSDLPSRAFPFSIYCISGVFVAWFSLFLTSASWLVLSMLCLCLYAVDGIFKYVADISLDAFC